jgi:hypothetical protein
MNRLIGIIAAALVIDASLASFASAQTQNAGAAPPGYHYETGGTTPVPDDPCWRLDPGVGGTISAAALSAVNASRGKPDGVSARVVSISDLATAGVNSLSSLSVWKYPGGAASITCHATLHFANGSAETGVLSFSNPGAYAPLQFQWLSDLKIANDIARIDGLRTSKHLYVAPDLKTPSIQACVGRAFALGASEQYPGQLWAACAQKGGSNLIPPTRASVNSSLDRCADKMAASPEYAWAMAHPEAKFSGDDLGFARAGLMRVYVWPGSPGDQGQKVLAFPPPGSGQPLTPMGESPQQQGEDVFQAEAVTLAGAYREIYSQMLKSGSSEAEATAGAVDEVKTDVRIWCAHTTQAQYQPQ